MSHRMSATMPEEFEEEIASAIRDGYKPSDMVIEGIRLFIQKRRWERKMKDLGIDFENYGEVTMRRSR